MLNVSAIRKAEKLLTTFLPQGHVSDDLVTSVGQVIDLPHTATMIASLLSVELEKFYGVRPTVNTVCNGNDITLTVGSTAFTYSIASAVPEQSVVIPASQPAVKPASNTIAQQVSKKKVDTAKVQVRCGEKLISLSTVEKEICAVAQLSKGEEFSINYLTVRLRRYYSDCINAMNHLISLGFFTIVKRRGYDKYVATDMLEKCVFTNVKHVRYPKATQIWRSGTCSGTIQQLYTEILKFVYMKNTPVTVQDINAASVCMKGVSQSYTNCVCAIMWGLGLLKKTYDFSCGKLPGVKYTLGPVENIPDYVKVVDFNIYKYLVKKQDTVAVNTIAHDIQETTQDCVSGLNRLRRRNYVESVEVVHGNDSQYEWCASTVPDVTTEK